ncbi:hypothetical protein AD998_12245 [bacterium 336/3]|nr:hypothetical protein AD998_12245 [bacterium 336/3]
MGCNNSTFTEQGVVGGWHPDNGKIIYKGENVQFKLKKNDNTVIFNNDNTCELPALEYTSKRGTWEIIEDDAVCWCKIHIKAANPIFNGIHSIYFDKYEQDGLLSYKIILKSNDLYFKGFKIILYSFDADMNNINKLLSQCGSEKECANSNFYSPKLP